jgi:hypothetical protein
MMGILWALAERQQCDWKAVQPLSVNFIPIALKILYSHLRILYTVILISYIVQLLAGI